MTGQMVRNLVWTHARQKAGEIRYNHSQRGFLTRSRHESRKVVRNSKKEACKTRCGSEGLRVLRH